MVCVLMTIHSSSVSGPGLLMISFGTAILPTSWSSAPNSTLRRSFGLSPISSATATDSETTLRLWKPVYSSSTSSTSLRSSVVPRYARLSSIAWRTRAPRSRANTSSRAASGSTSSTA